jgi:uncharacterized membrane protein
MTDVLVPTGPTAAATPSRPRVRPVWPGIVSFALGLATAGALATGIVLATDDRYQFATWAAWAAVGISVLAVLLGLVALIVGRDRAWAVAGVLLGAIANPLVLTPALDVIGSLWA